jgi:hypothetical protein
VSTGSPPRRGSRRCPLARLAALALLLPAGCAWANRDNRPLWNAFETHAVPEEGTWFVAALPLTVPGGLVAIVLDTLVVHPAQVVDDAAGDAGDVWNGIEWRERYYSELALLPLRAAATPLVFVGGFLGRSCFDIAPHQPARTPEETRRLAERHDRERASRWLDWLQGLAAGETAEPGREAAPTWSAELDAAYAAARQDASATGRLALYETSRRLAPPPWLAEPWMGLTDPDPAIRYLELTRLEAPGRVPATVRAALRADASALVSELARRVWP